MIDLRNSVLEWELSGRDLNYQVACWEVDHGNYEMADLIEDDVILMDAVENSEHSEMRGFIFSPATQWEQAGPIITREKISINYTGKNWKAAMMVFRGKRSFRHECYGKNPLEAAMRVYCNAMAETVRHSLQPKGEA